MRINYNVSAMLSNNALANNDRRLAQSLEKLSSGLKVNHAKDNPAGLAMAKRMNAQIVGVSTAGQNAADGVSVLETADGALTEVTEMIQRMNELAIKSANGTLSENDRNIVQKEVDQLKEEITRISEVTEFNGQPLLNGEYELKGYTNQVDIKVNYYSTDVSVREYTIDNLQLSQEWVAIGNSTAASVPAVGTPPVQPATTAVMELRYKIDNIKFGDGFPADATAYIQDDLLVIKGGEGFEMKLDISQAQVGVDYGTSGPAAGGVGLTIDATGIGPMRLQVGANEGQVLEVCIPAITLQNMNIEKLDVTTKAGAEDGIVRLSNALTYINEVRGRLGAYQNRLESTENSLDITHENMTSAYSRIMDVDMAEEMTNYTTSQVLTQAGTSMLAQANERPSQVLQLLQ